jgi:hypothetical protein
MMPLDVHTSSSVKARLLMNDLKGVKIVVVATAQYKWLRYFLSWG